jgi:allantoin racemase
MRIRVIMPVTTRSSQSPTKQGYVAAARPDSEISVVGLDRGPASLESDYEDALAVPDLLNRVRGAAREGVDALIIDCMADPGLGAARELVSIPVVGAAQASMHMAAILAHRFSVVTILERDTPLIERLARLYGLKDKLASTRPVNIPVLELDKDRPRLLEALIDQSAKAILEDRAHAIVFGCTGMIGLARSVQEGLAQRGCEVPVIDPSLAALKWAESLVDTALAHSKRTYPYPPEKEISGYEEGLSPSPKASRGRGGDAVRLRIVIPVVGEKWVARVIEAYGRFARPGTQISAVALDKGPSSIESRYDEAIAVPDLLLKLRVAQEEGMDAVLIDCMGDPGLEAAREALSIPVVGPAQVSMHLAAALAHRFSVITVLSQTIPSVYRQVQGYGLIDKVASVRAVEIPVLEMERDTRGLVEALVEEAARAVVEDGAHIIIPGCTEMIGLASEVQEDLAQRGCEAAVIDPPAVAVKMAEALVDMGLAHSKRSYPAPPKKALVGYP